MCVCVQAEAPRKLKCVACFELRLSVLEVYITRAHSPACTTQQQIAHTAKAA